MLLVARFAQSNNRQREKEDSMAPLHHAICGFYRHSIHHHGNHYHNHWMESLVIFESSLIWLLSISSLRYFWRQIKKLSLKDQRCECRIFTVKQFLFWLLDIPTAIGALIIFVTVYRIKNTIEGFKLVSFALYLSIY